MKIKDTANTTNIVDDGSLDVSIECKYCGGDIGTISIINYSGRKAESLYRKHCKEHRCD